MTNDAAGGVLTNTNGRSKMKEPDALPDDCSDSPSYMLYSPAQVGLATLLGTLLAGCILLTANYRRLGKITCAVLTLTAGFFGTALGFIYLITTKTEKGQLFDHLLSLSWATGESSLPFEIALVWVMIATAMFATAMIIQGRTYQSHLAQGGRKQSSIEAVQIGMVCIVGLLVCFPFFFLIFGLCSFLLSPPTRWN